MSIFDVPAAAIDADLVDAFLNERVAESLNVEYKRELNDRVYETIAAMANTYGGVILVGVDEDENDDPPRPLLPPVGVARGEMERLVNTCYSLLAPPFAPDVRQVTTSSGADVLVVRVDPLRADRPVFVSRKDSHRVFVRLEARNASADRYRLASLFAEPSAASFSGTPGVWGPDHGRSPVDDWGGFGPSFGARVAIEAQLPFERVRSAMIDGDVKLALDDALRGSQLTEWFESYLTRSEESFEGDWLPLAEQYGNHSSAVVRRWRGRFLFNEPEVETPVAGQAQLLLPLYVPTALAGRVTLLLDAAFNPRTFEPFLASLPKRFQLRSVRLDKLRLEDVYHLLLALLSTALDAVAPAVFTRLLGVPKWRTIGPVVYLTSYLDNYGNSGLGQFIDLESYVDPRITANLTLPRSNPLEFPPGLSFENAANREEAVKSWLTRLLLDMALDGFERDVDAFQ